MSHIEQRASIRFCVLLGKTFTETWNLVKQAYGEAALSRTQVYDWHRRFKEGRESIEDDARSGRPSTSRNTEKINEVRDLVRADRRLTIQELADATGISFGSCQAILSDDLNMHRVCQHMVPKNLTEEQRQQRMEICGDNIDTIDKDPGKIRRIITGDETWCYLYDPQTKRQSSVWKTPSSPRPQKVRADRSKGKVMLEVFFDSQGIVHYEFIPEGCTVNKELYLAVLRRLRDAVRRKRPELWAENSWILHHDNAPAHRAFVVTEYLTKHGVTVLSQPPYSPDLAPCDFHLFPKLKAKLKGCHFYSSDEVTVAATKALKEVAQEGLQHVFEDLYGRWQKCITAQGHYFEGGSC